MRFMAMLKLRQMLHKTKIFDKEFLLVLRFFNNQRCLDVIYRSFISFCTCCLRNVSSWFRHLSLQILREIQINFHKTLLKILLV